MTFEGVQRHALMFAWLARAAVEGFGEPGRRTVLEGVRRYGRQRGRRMAEHAVAEGMQRNMVSFKLFGEIPFGDTENINRVDRYAPRFEQTTTLCSWCNAWQQSGLLEFGRLYCEEIDAAIAEGFDPALGFEATSTLSHGDADCHFVYHGASLNKEQQEQLARGKQTVGAKYLRPWAYHIAELYSTISSALVERFGSAGAQAAEQALAEYGRNYGDEAAAAVEQ